MNDSTKNFRVVSVSKNTNSFGLRGFIVVARDGEAWEIAGNHLVDLVKGDDFVVKLNDNGVPHFAGFELPRRVEDAPFAVLNEVYKD